MSKHTPPTPPRTVVWSTPVGWAHARLTPDGEAFTEAAVGYATAADALTLAPAHLEWPDPDPEVLDPANQAEMGMSMSQMLESVPRMVTVVPASDPEPTPEGPHVAPEATEPEPPAPNPTEPHAPATIRLAAALAVFVAAHPAEFHAPDAPAAVADARIVPSGRGSTYHLTLPHSQAQGIADRIGLSIAQGRATDLRLPVERYRAVRALKMITEDMAPDRTR